MKKYLMLLVLYPFVAFSEPFSIPYRGEWQSDFTFKSYTNSADFSSSDLTSVQLRYLSRFQGVRFYTNEAFQVSTSSGSSTSFSFTNPVLDLEKGRYLILRDLPLVASAFTLIAKLHSSGFVPDHWTANGYKYVGTNSSYVYINCNPIQFLSLALLSTNDLYRSTVVNSLSSLGSDLSSLVSQVSSINSFLPSLLSGTSSNVLDRVYLDGTYNVVPASFHNSAAFDGLARIDNGKYLLDLLNSLGFEGDDVNDPVYQDPLFVGRNSGLSSFADSVFSQAANAFILDQTSPDPKYGNFNDALGDLSGTLSTLANFSFATPLTNALQGLDGEWKDKVKENLQAVKDDITNRLDKTTWSGYVNKSTNDLDSISRSSSSTAGSASDIASLLQNAQNGSGLRVDLPPGPYNVNVMNWPSDLKISLNKDSLDFMSETVGTIASKWDTWFGYWSSWNSDYYYPSLLEQSGFFYNVTNQLNRFLSVSNVLDDILVSITNLDLSLTNSSSYMLLSDYADYINSSGLSDLLDVLDEDEYSDFKSAVDSIGHADVAHGYGRWWRYFTGLSTVQANSIFKMSNIFQAHEKLLSDLKRDNSDVSDLSDSSVFRDLLSKIPSQTHIDNKLSEITNSIDQSGFVRIRQLIPDLSNRLSVASALYDHDFALPTDISWVLIPADSELHIQERVVHISPSEHYRVFQVLHYGIAFSYCIVNIILLPKFLLLLVRLFDRVWNKSEHLIYNSTQS